MKEFNPDQIAKESLGSNGVWRSIAISFNENQIQSYLYLKKDGTKLIVTQNLNTDTGSKTILQGDHYIKEHIVEKMEREILVMYLEELTGRSCMSIEDELDHSYHEIESYLE